MDGTQADFHVFSERISQGLGAGCRSERSQLPYGYDGDIISPDSIHAPGDSDKTAWASFLQAFNDWAQRRGGGPLPR